MRLTGDVAPSASYIAKQAEFCKTRASSARRCGRFERIGRGGEWLGQQPKFLRPQAVAAALAGRRLGAFKCDLLTVRLPRSDMAAGACLAG